MGSEKRREVLRLPFVPDDNDACLVSSLSVSYLISALGLLVSLSGLSSSFSPVAQHFCRFYFDVITAVGSSVGSPLPGPFNSSRPIPARG